MREWIIKMFVNGEIKNEENTFCKVIFIILGILFAFAVAKSLFGMFLAWKSEFFEFSLKGTLQKHFSPNPYYSYNRKVERYMNNKVKTIFVFKYYLAPQILFATSILAMLVGLEVIPFAPLAEHLNITFKISFVIFCISLVWFAVLYFKSSDLDASVNIITSLDGMQREFLPEDIITTNYYEKWDYEPDSAYRLTGSTSYDANLGDNVEIAVLNIFYRVLQIVLLIFFVLWHAIYTFFMTVYVLICLPFNWIRPIRIRETYKRYLVDIAKDKYSGSGDGNLLINVNNSPIALNTEAKVLSKYVGKTLTHLKNKDKMFLFVGRQKTNYNVRVVKDLIYTGYDKDLKQDVFVYECQHGRLFVTLNTNNSPRTPAGFYSYFLPFTPSSLWGRETKFYEAVYYPPLNPIRLLYIQKAQYYFLKTAKETLSDNAPVRLFIVSKEKNDLLPVDVKLGDVELDHKTQVIKLRFYTHPPRTRTGVWKRGKVLSYRRLLELYRLPTQDTQSTQPAQPTQPTKPTQATKTEQPKTPSQQPVPSKPVAAQAVNKTVVSPPKKEPTAQPKTPTQAKPEIKDELGELLGYFTSDTKN